MENVGIILEGGAMRSVFSAGVLDFFLDNDIQIPNVMAVSAGAYAGMNYVSGQRGRVLKAIIEPMEKEKYFGFSTFLRKGTFFDMDLLFNEIPKTRAPFDFEAFSASAKRFITSTVNCITGEAVYHQSFEDEDNFLEICRAANSLPFIGKVTDIDGIPMLDGGMADAIPIEKALEEGWDKVVVVVTRNAKYRKKKRYLYLTMIRLLYHKYPKFARLVEGRADRYNHSLDLLERMEEEGKAFVLRPSDDVYLVNHEANVDTLRDYYHRGYEMAKEKMDELKEFLK
ncbi:patatin-like phospholipase family protein [Kineothrix sp. MB12-C1]|uniref:patatin-like phospholipase family protein n=1 Tax=Kineothrix sp. MB12-C1 TaxID=3070215 RepID=UPI0027D21BF6|nr:patatin family protein [Kineothrix sp. MB12-C1]WMC91873.1 patatin family protein [Kineothrix sp. MB12-C1]